MNVHILQSPRRRFAHSRAQRRGVLLAQDNTNVVQREGVRGKSGGGIATGGVEYLAAEKVIGADKGT